jgi:Domain of unknown function (DUF4382)
MKRFVFGMTLALAGILVACSGGNSAQPVQNQRAALFLTGEDAPLPSLLSFNVTFNSITLNTSTGSTQVLSQPTTIDFVRLIGLNTLVGFNSVPPGTYNSATFELANPVITYLNLGVNPSTSTLNGTLTKSTVTVALVTPLTVGSGGLAGIHIDFNLAQSLQVDKASQITGVVNPTLRVKPVNAADDEAQITDLHGSLVSVNASGNSLVVQRSWGPQVTVDVNSSTQFNRNWNLNNLTTPAFLSVEGKMQPDGSILASDVDVTSNDTAVVAGPILALNPSTGPVKAVTLYLSEERPMLSNMPIFSVQTIDVSQVSDYEVHYLPADSWFSGLNLPFNSSALVVGQRIVIGGTYDSSTNTFTPAEIRLPRQGVAGQVVSGSVQVSSGNTGNFQLANNTLVGYLLGGPMTVNTGSGTKFLGVSGLGDLNSTNTVTLRASGLVFQGTNASGNPIPVMYAHRVHVWK